MKRSLAKGLLVAGLAALIYTVTATGCGGDQHIPDNIVTHITKTRAVTLSDKTALYFGDNSPDDQCLKAHEDAHKRQAAMVCQALVNIGAIYDDEETCALTWISVYTIDWLVHQGANRFEKGAREESSGACRTVSR